MHLESALSTLLLFAVTTPVAYANACPKVCPDKWIPFKGSCYLFVAQKMNFFDAETYCQEFGGHLVSVESHVENLFLKDQLANLKDGSTWLGFTDINVEGVYVWYGSGNQLTYTDWVSGEPNNNGNQDCGIFWYNQSYRWGDISCNELLRFICEQ